MNRETYSKLINAAEIKQGSIVLVQYWGENLMSEDITNIQAALVQNGCTPVLLIQSREQNQVIFSEAEEGCYGEKFFRMLENADVVIDLLEHHVSMLKEPLPEKKMEICGQYMQQIFQLAYSREKCIQIRIPNEQNAKEEGIPTEEYVNRMTEAYQVDYAKLKQECRRKKEQLSEKEKLTLVTGKAKEYRLELTWKDREWNLDCGDGDLPCGEVYVAPNEGICNGQIYYETLYLDHEHKFEDVVFTIENGAIVTSDQPEVNEFLETLQKEDKIVCELGFGMNPNIRDLCGCAVLDEKMADTFHIAIGNNQMFGGTNEAGEHIDMVGTAEIIL